MRHATRRTASWLPGRGFRWMALAWVLLASPAAVLAQDGRHDDEARALFEAGRVAFEAGRFENALDSFRRAYELSERPALLYNIGTTADRLRRDREALEAFERYLEAVPDPSHRSQVEARIEVLRESVATRERLEAEAQREAEPDTPAQDPSPVEDVDARGAETIGEPEGPMEAGEPRADAGEAETDAGAEPSGAMMRDDAVEAAPPADALPPVSPSAEGSSSAPWILLGVSGALVVGGAVLLALAAADISTVENASDGDRWEDIRDAHDRVPLLSTVGWAMLGVGLAGGASALVWGLSDSGSAGERIAVGVGPTSVTLRGRF